MCSGEARPAAAYTCRRLATTSSSSTGSVKSWSWQYYLLWEPKPTAGPTSPCSRIGASRLPCIAANPLGAGDERLACARVPLRLQHYSEMAETFGGIWMLGAELSLSYGESDLREWAGARSLRVLAVSGWTSPSAKRPMAKARSRTCRAILYSFKVRRTISRSLRVPAVAGCVGARLGFASWRASARSRRGRGRRSSGRGWCTPTRERASQAG